MNNKTTRPSARVRYVELTESGPVLGYSAGDDIESVRTIEKHSVSDAQWDELQALLQTGELTNDKVKEVIKVKQ